MNNPRPKHTFLLIGLALFVLLVTATIMNLFIYLFRRSAEGNSQLSQNSFAKLINSINADLLPLLFLAIICTAIMSIFGLALIKSARISYIQKNKIFILLVLLSISPGLIGLTGVKDLSTTENRSLAEMPEFNMTINSFRKFPGGFETFLNDHLPLRNYVNQYQKKFFFYNLGISPVSNVVIGKNNWLYFTDGRPYDEVMGIPQLNGQTPLEVAAYFDQESSWLASQNIRFYLVIAPDKETIYPEWLPDSVHRYLLEKTSLDMLVSNLTSFPSINLIDLRTPLLDAKNNYQVYYKTDTHWNDIGALIAYQEIIKRICTDMPCGLPRTIADFTLTEETVQNLDLARFLGIPDLSETEIKLTPNFERRSTVIKEGESNISSIISYVEDQNFPTAIFFHDSFFYYLVPNVTEHFKKAKFLNEAYSREIIENDKPDIVIIELVERKLIEPNFVLKPGSPSNMKIGYLMQAGVPDLFEQPLGGPAIHVREVIRELQSLGHTVCLLARLKNQTWKSENLVDFTPVEVRWLDKGPIRLFERIIRTVQWRFRLPYIAFWDSLRFAHACRQELFGFNLLYERMGWFGYGGELASRWLRIPLVLEVNGDHLDELQSLHIEPHGIQKWLSTMLVKWAANHADHVVSTGEGWRKKFIDRWQTDPTKGSVIENGSSLVNILKRDQLKSFSENGNVDDTLVFIGGFDPWQGIHVLLRAFARALNQGINANLVLIGSGTEEPTVRGLINELRINNHVRLMGKLPVSDYAPLLGQADIGVSPYCGRVEFSGLKLLDYKAAGLAIIASGRDGQPSVLKDGQTGWVVPPCDEEALCKAIVGLCNDSVLKKRLGRAARIEAEKLHSWEHTVMQLDQLFSKLITK